MPGVFAVIFTLGFSLQGVTGGSFSGSKVGGRRTCHGSRERVNTRSSPVDDSSETCADRRLVLGGFCVDVSGRCCALLGPPGSSSLPDRLL